MQPRSGSADAPGSDAAGRVAVPDGVSSYPGGKSGAGIYQRLINMIPRHRVLISAFAGQCGVTRNIKPAEHTIVIDADEDVCAWWDKWRRSRKGRDLEIHHCDSIEWLRFRFGLTEYSAPGACVARAGVSDRDADQCVGHGSRTNAMHAVATVANRSDAAVPQSSVLPGTANRYSGGRLSRDDAAEAFVFGDPPYVLAERSHGKQYRCELSDDDHARLLRILTLIPPSTAAVMLCGYRSPIYAAVDRLWRSIDHRVPTRGGLQDERIWMNYPKPIELHDYRYIGKCRRSRERIRRRQRNWVAQLQAMPTMERDAMLEALNDSVIQQSLTTDHFGGVNKKGPTCATT